MSSHVFAETTTFSQRHVDLHVWLFPRRSYIGPVPSVIEIRSGALEPLGSKFGNFITLAIGF